MIANAVRLQLHALAYNLANLLRTLALPIEMDLLTPLMTRVDDGTPPDEIAVDLSIRECRGRPARSDPWFNMMAAASPAKPGDLIRSAAIGG